MRTRRSDTLSCVARTLAFLAGIVAVAATAADFDWAPYRDESTVEIITVDEDGSRRETTIWIVVVDGAGFVRTNDSRWLANIRRDPNVELRSRGVESPFTAEIADDPETFDRVEAAFKAKYGWLQRVMSAFRTTRPTVLRVVPRAAP